MNAYPKASIAQPQPNAAFLGQIIDSFIGIIAAPKPVSRQPVFGAFSELQRVFATSEGLPKSLLIVRVENDAVHGEAHAHLAQQEKIMQQLEKTCGLHAYGAPIGDDEYAVLLLGVDQCSELIPRLENILSRSAAGHLIGDGASLKCRVGVARCPIDTDELGESIRMASLAAAELSDSELGYQFISRRHRLS